VLLYAAVEIRISPNILLYVSTITREGKHMHDQKIFNLFLLKTSSIHEIMQYKDVAWLDSVRKVKS